MNPWFVLGTPILAIPGWAEPRETSIGQKIHAGTPVNLNGRNYLSLGLPGQGLAKQYL